MYRKILIPVDLSERHAPVFELARSLLSEGGTLILLHVVESIAGARDAEISKFYERIEHQGEECLARWTRELQVSAGTVEAVLKIGRRGSEIVRCATEHDCDLILMSSRAVEPVRPDGGFGTTSHQVALLAPCSVMLVRGASTRSGSIPKIRTTSPTLLSARAET